MFNLHIFSFKTLDLSVDDDGSLLEVQQSHLTTAAVLNRSNRTSSKMRRPMFLGRRLRNCVAQFGFDIHRTRSNGQKLTEAKNILVEAISCDQSLLLKRMLTNAFEVGLKSKSQIMQDVFALTVSGDKENGFFVEFGGADGVEGSNTYLLEKHFGWRGILSEPNAAFADALRKSRHCTFDPKCVWEVSGETVSFTETRHGQHSTISSFTKADHHSRDVLRSYPVETISLLDLLTQHNAPRFVDYLSIDTEGSEYLILKSFDFSAYQFGCITVEHNFIEKARRNLFELLSVSGYRRVLEDISLFDDWYVLDR